MAKSAQRQFLVSVSGITGLWATKTGGDPTSSVTKVWDGGADSPDILSSPADFDDLTVTRPYDVSRDGPVAASLKPQVGRFTATISVQPTDANLVKTSAAEKFTGLLTKLTSPAPDASASGAATISLTFAIQKSA